MIISLVEEACLDLIKTEYDYFLKVFDEKSFTRASEATGIQQAGLSKAIKKIEDIFGEKLFIRRPRSLEPTEFGIYLQRQIQEQQVAWHEGLKVIFKDLKRVAGKITIGAHSTIAINSLSKIFCDINEAYKDLTLDIVFERSTQLTQKVVNCEIDLALVINPVNYPDLVIKRIKKEDLALWSTRKNFEEIIYFNPEMIDIISTLKKFKNFKKIPIPDYEVLAHFLLESKGVGLLPSPVAKRFKRLKPVQGVLKSVDLCLVYRHDHIKTEAFKTIISKF